MNKKDHGSSTTGAGVGRYSNVSADRIDIKKIIFEYLRDNLQINVKTSPGGSYYEEPSVDVSISLRNPETDKYEVLTGASDYLPNNS